MLYHNLLEGRILTHLDTLPKILRNGVKDV